MVMAIYSGHKMLSGKKKLKKELVNAEITVFERSGYISYANCGLPYYIGDVITDPEELTLQTPESFFKRFRINMKIHHEVISIHPERKTAVSYTHLIGLAAEAVGKEDNYAENTGYVYQYGRSGRGCL